MSKKTCFPFRVKPIYGEREFQALSSVPACPAWQCRLKAISLTHTANVFLFDFWWVIHFLFHFFLFFSIVLSLFSRAWQCLGVSAIPGKTSGSSSDQNSGHEQTGVGPKLRLFFLLLGANGIATRNKEPTNGAPGLTTNGAIGRYERSKGQNTS